MTTLTITLAPDLYARLRDAAQRQGKDAPELVQELVAEHLAVSDDEPPFAAYPALPPEMKALLATMTDADLIVPPKGTPEDAIRLLQSWNEEDAANGEEEGEGTWEDLLQAIDESRHSYRKLFPEREKTE